MASGLNSEGTEASPLFPALIGRWAQVLDGCVVAAAEQAAARNKYAGRLTLDFLEERLGHRAFDRIRELDCSSLKIRDAGSVFLGDDFAGLQELCLDSNLLVDVSGERAPGPRGACACASASGWALRLRGSVFRGGGAAGSRGKGAALLRRASQQGARILAGQHGPSCLLLLYRPRALPYIRTCICIPARCPGRTRAAGSGMFACMHVGEQALRALLHTGVCVCACALQAWRCCPTWGCCA